MVQINNPLYKSTLTFDNIRYELSELNEGLLNYCQDKFIHVSQWYPEESRAKIHIFHQNGITVDYRALYTGEKCETLFSVDIKLVSDQNNTSGLEEKLKEETIKYKKNSK